jgi:hypothetical protein
MAKHTRRRQRRSPTSSSERPPQEPEEDLIAVESHSGQRAHQSPAEQDDQSARQSPVVPTTFNPRAPLSPVAFISPGQSVREDPADDENLRSDANQIHGDRSPSERNPEAGLTVRKTSSPKRKVLSSDLETASETLRLLQEELRQLRKERDDREREIALSSRLSQHVPGAKAFDAPSATKSPRISTSADGGAGNNGNSVRTASPKPSVPPLTASAAEASESEATPGEKFTAVPVGAVPVAPATPLERDPSPPRIIIDDGQSDEANARQESSSEDERPPPGRKDSTHLRPTS